jgi:hypothetical protein
MARKSLVAGPTMPKSQARINLDIFWMFFLSIRKGLSTSITAFALCGLIVFWFSHFDGKLLGTLAIAGGRYTPIAIAVTCFGIASTLALAKVEAKWTCGIVEISFGVWSAYFVTKHLNLLTLKFNDLLPYAAIVFVIARGLVNCKDAGDEVDRWEARMNAQRDEYFQKLSEEETETS